MKKPPSIRQLLSNGGHAPKMLLAGLVLGLATWFAASPIVDAEPAAKVRLNGKAIGVFFNDGDSFRVLKGRNKGAKARLAGFNTLETHGAVHQWGTWKIRELYHIAKMATLHARKGSWSCESDGKTDTYGRLLAWCQSLAVDQVRRGFAHAMSINDDPAKPEVLAAQREAILNKRGMWAHGVPEFVLTSLHSAEEDVEGRGTYNRLVSSEDGHSIKWKHNDTYEECSTVCNMVYAEDKSLLPAVAKRLLSEAPNLVEGVSEDDLNTVLGTYQRVRLVDRPVPSEHRDALNKLLSGYADEGLFGTGPASNGSCVVHVPFERRFGGTRAECLKK
jgi:endonuclease YncB( thermonuclease family)